LFDQCLDKTLRTEKKQTYACCRICNADALLRNAFQHLCLASFCCFCLKNLKIIRAKFEHLIPVIFKMLRIKVEIFPLTCVSNFSDSKSYIKLSELKYFSNSEVYLMRVHDDLAQML